MGFFSGLQAKLYALGGLLLAAAVTYLRIKQLEGQRDAARRKAKVFKAQRDQERSNAAIDKQITIDRNAANKKARQDIRDGKVPDSLGPDLNKFD